MKALQILILSFALILTGVNVLLGAFCMCHPYTCAVASEACFSACPPEGEIYCEGCIEISSWCTNCGSFSSQCGSAWQCLCSDGQWRRINCYEDTGDCFY